MARRPIDYRAVARYQRLLQYSVLALLLANVMIIVFAGMAPISRPGRTPAVFIASQAAYMAVLLAIAVIVILLMVAQRRHPLSIALLVLGLLIPLVNLLVVLSVNAQATRLLKAKGLRVGLLGTTSVEEFKLLPGHCQSCGYDLSGLGRGVPCPECGRAKPIGSP